MPARSNRESKFLPFVKLEYGDRSFKAARDEGIITAEDEERIREFVREKTDTQHISDGRQLKITYTLIGWRRFLPKPYTELTFKDVSQGIRNLKAGENGRGEPLKQNTQHDYTRILKSFLFWMIESGYSTLPAGDLKKIKLIKRDYDTTEPSELLTMEDIFKLLSACRQPRDRALISTLYESGARIGEVARIEWRDFEFDEHGVKLHIRDSKGEKRRYSRLVTLAPAYLTQWRESYQADTGLSPTGQNRVFLTVGNRPIEYQTVHVLLKRLTTRAGLEKRVHAHLFRKSRITHMIADGFSESIVKEIMWKNTNTEMFRTYLKLSEMDVDAELLDKAGVVPKEVSTPEAAKEIKCGNCFEKNGPTNRYCWKCGFPLTTEAKTAKHDAETLADASLAELIENPEQNKEQLKRLKAILASID